MPLGFMRSGSKRKERPGRGELRHAPESCDIRSAAAAAIDLAAEQGARRGAADRAGGAIAIAIDLTAAQRAGGAAHDHPGRSARPAPLAMTRPIIATIPIMSPPTTHTRKRLEPGT